jgi:hypothetical protein
MAKLGPLPDVANVVKIRLIGQNMGHPWVNVLHAKYTGGTIDSVAMSSMATSIRTAWGTNLAPQFITNSSLQTVECTDIASRTGAQGTDSVGVTGTDATAGASAAVAACVTLVIARRYRGGHPRVYLSGVNASKFTSGSTWGPGVANAYATAFGAFRTAINALSSGGATWQLCSVSYFHKVGGLEAYKVPPDVDVITGVKMHTRIDSMRRRLGKELS